MLQPVRPSGGRTTPPSPPVSMEDDAVPGPSGAGPNESDAGRAASGTPLSSIRRGPKRGRRAHPAGGAAAAAKRARTELEDGNGAASAALAQFKMLCKSRGIEIKETLYTLLDSCLEEQKPGLINKLICFFQHVDTQRVKNTHPITSMMGQSRVGRSIRQLLEMSDADVAWMASHPHLRSISSICCNKGVPAKAKVESFLAQPCLHKGGALDAQLLRMVSSIYTSKGLPDSCTALAELLALPVLCAHGRPNLKLVGTLSTMCSTKGLPEITDVINLLALDCLKSGGKVDQELLSIVASICAGKGLPDSARVQELLTHGKLQKGGKVDVSVLRALNRMYGGRGMPPFEDVQALLALPCLNKKDARQREVLDSQALAYIATVQSGLGSPNTEYLTALSSVPVLYHNGQFDQRVLHCIATLYHKQGWPAAAELQRLFALPGICSQGQINIAMLRCVAALGSGYGFPERVDIKKIKSYLGSKDARLKAGPIKIILESPEAEVHLPTLTKWLVSQGFVKTQNPTAATLPGQRKKRTQPTATQTASEAEALEQATATLFDFCQQRKITISKTLPSLIKNCAFDQQGELIRKITLFLENVNPNEVKSSGMLTSMLGRSRPGRHGPLEAFLKMSDQDIVSVAQCRSLKSIACMCYGKGLPSPQAIEALLGLPVFKTAGVFKHELLNIIAVICTSKGFPTETEVKTFLQLDALKGADGVLDLDRLRSVAIMCRRRGFPAAAAVTSLWSHPAFVRSGVFRADWFAPVVTMFSGKGLPRVDEINRLFASKELMVAGAVDLPLLKRIASMSHGRGLSSIGNLSALFAMEELLVAGQVDARLLHCICTLFSGKGIPHPDDLKGLWQLKELQTGNKLDPELLLCIASMNLRRGLPDLANVRQLLSLSALHSRGALDVRRLKYLARLFHGRGVPDADKVKKFLTRPDLAPGGELNLSLLRHLGRLGSQRGFPTEQIIEQARAELSAPDFVDDDEDDEEDIDDAAGVDALADLAADDPADADMDEELPGASTQAAAPPTRTPEAVPRARTPETAPRARTPETTPRSSPVAVVMGDSIEDAPPVAERAGSPGASDGFELPDDFDIEQAVTGLSFDFWESGFGGVSSFDELLASTSTSTSTSTSADTALPPAADPSRQPLASIEFWESFTMPVDATDSTTAEDAMPSTSSAPPSSPPLVGQPRSYLARRDSKDKN